MTNKTCTPCKGRSKLNKPSVPNLAKDHLQPSTSQINNINSKGQRERNPDENPKKRKLARINNDPITYPIPEEHERAHEIKTEQIYGTGHYGKRKDGSEMYATNFEGGQYVLKDKYAKVVLTNTEGEIEHHETLPNDKDGNNFFIEVNGEKMYPTRTKRNVSAVILEIDPITNEERYFKDKDGNEIYSKNSLKTQFYRKDSSNREVPIIAKGYAQDGNGFEIYPKDDEQKERYLMKFDGDFPSEYAARGPTGLYYARDSDGDEFYPRKFPDKKIFTYPYFYQKYVEMNYPVIPAPAPVQGAGGVQDEDDDANNK